MSLPTQIPEYKKEVRETFHTPRSVRLHDAIHLIVQDAYEKSKEQAYTPP